MKVEDQARTAGVFEDAICLSARNMPPAAALTGITMACVRVYLASIVDGKKADFLVKMGDIFDICTQSLEDNGHLKRGGIDTK
jgi:hypothetical protein